MLAKLVWHGGVCITAVLLCSKRCARVVLLAESTMPRLQLIRIKRRSVNRQAVGVNRKGRFGRNGRYLSRKRNVALGISDIICWPFSLTAAVRVTPEQADGSGKVSAPSQFSVRRCGAACKLHRNAPGHIPSVIRNGYL